MAEAIDTFVNDSRDAMSDRMWDGVRRGWGMSWRKADYTDAEVMERLDRAVVHLTVALANYRDGHVGSDELRKRAADVSNQAFMLADPARLGEP
jgi:hypothetical protein